MYHSPARVRAFFVAVGAATLLAACSGRGMNATPTGGLSTQTGGAYHPMAGGGVTPTPVPTVAPTPTPAGPMDYVILTGLKMDDAGNFSEIRAECTHDAEGFESESDISLPVAAVTTLPVCTQDDDSDHHRHDDLSRFSRPGVTPTPVPTVAPTPTPTPGDPTDLVIIRTGGGDDEDHGWHRGHHRGGNIVVLTTTASSFNGVWSFPALGITNDLKAEHRYRFFVAHQVPESSEQHGHHDHD